MDAHQHVNPYIAGAPVTGTEMFFGREDVFSFVRRNLIGQHRDTPIVLYGQRRTGKTSVLFQLQRHLDPRYQCIFIDLQAFSLDGEANLMWGIANSISRGLKRDHQIDVGIPDRAAFFADPRSVFETVFLDAVWSALGNNHLVVMMDEVARLDEEVRAGRLKREIFDYLRYLMQHFADLNFVFSLGSGLEEIKKDYALLFSVALYHRISFLEPAAARALITQPVPDHYQVTDDAVEKILQITSRHPYYTQLLCHCLFDRWLRSQKPAMTGTDIDSVLGEAIELGSANLTFVWEDSTPGEQAMMAGMAAVMNGERRSATIDHVREAWRKIGVSLPEGDALRAVQSLTSREVLAGEQAYSFAVDLQRLWLDKHRRLDWVKEQLAETVQEGDGFGTGPTRTADTRHETEQGGADGVIDGQFQKQGGAPAGVTPAGPTKPTRRRRLSRRSLVAAVAGLLSVAITATLLILTLGSRPVTATSAVAAVQPDRLTNTLLNTQFAATDVPSGTSASTSQLSPVLTSLTSTSENTPKASGLVATVQTSFSGVGEIGVRYYAFGNVGDANSYFSSTDLIPDGYKSAGSFGAAGIGDSTECMQATTSAQLTSWACLTLSDYVVSYSWVIENGTRNGASLESELALDAVRHLRSAAEATPPASLPQPSGSLQAGALFAKLNSSFPTPLVPEGASVLFVKNESAVPVPGLVGPNKRIGIAFLSSESSYTNGDITFYVFDTAQAAQSWFSDSLEPVNPAGKTDTRTNQLPFAPSDFSSSQPVQCNTYSQTAVAAGVSACYVQWGDVVVSAVTKKLATASNKAPGAADSNMTLTLARAALLRVGQIIAP